MFGKSTIGRFVLTQLVLEAAQARVGVDHDQFHIGHFGKDFDVAGVDLLRVGCMMRAARKQLGLTSAETVMVGDTMETDILGGVGLGYRTILVMSGGTTSEDLQDFAYSPDLVLNSVADIPEILSFADRASVLDVSQEIPPAYTMA